MHCPKTSQAVMGMWGAPACTSPWYAHLLCCAGLALFLHFSFVHPIHSLLCLQLQRPAAACCCSNSVLHCDSRWILVTYGTL
jgi:hypothetical protein